MGRPMVTITATVRAITAKSVQASVHGFEIWIPRSQILDQGHGLRAGETRAMDVTKWIAEKRGLIQPYEAKEY